jgi:hypothetical protein
MLIARIRQVLYGCLTLTLFLPYFALDAGVIFPPDPLDCLGACPYSTSALDRQANQPDTLLLTSKNRDNNQFAGTGGSDRIGSRAAGNQANRDAKSIIASSTPYSRACLWYTPLFPIPPPRP